MIGVVVADANTVDDADVVHVVDAIIVVHAADLADDFSVSPSQTEFWRI